LRAYKTRKRDPHRGGLITRGARLATRNNRSFLRDARPGKGLGFENVPWTLLEEGLDRQWNIGETGETELQKSVKAL